MGRFSAFVAVALLFSCGKNESTNVDSNSEPALDTGMGPGAPPHLEGAIVSEVASTGSADSLAADSGYVYWADRTDLFAMSKHDGSITRLATGLPADLTRGETQVTNMIVDENYAFAISRPRGENSVGQPHLLRIAKSGGQPPQDLLSASEVPLSISQSRTDLFWAADVNGALFVARMSKSGGPIERFLDLPAGTIEVLGESIYALHGFQRTASGRWQGHLTRVTLDRNSTIDLGLASPSYRLTAAPTAVYMRTWDSIDETPITGGGAARVFEAAADNDGSGVVPDISAAGRWVIWNQTRIPSHGIPYTCVCAFDTVTRSTWNLLDHEPHGNLMAVSAATNAAYAIAWGRLLRINLPQ
jgi:hypothetical protein